MSTISNWHCQGPIYWGVSPVRKPIVVAERVALPLIFAGPGCLTVCGHLGAAAFLLKKCLCPLYWKFLDPPRVVNLYFTGQWALCGNMLIRVCTHTCKVNMPRNMPVSMLNNREIELMSLSTWYCSHIRSFPASLVSHHFSLTKDTGTGKAKLVFQWLA